MISVWVGNQRGAKSEIDYYADALWGQNGGCSKVGGPPGEPALIALTKKKKKNDGLSDEKSLNRGLTCAAVPSEVIRLGAAVAILTH